ncbi:MAG: glycine--tRNA ligase subunit beta [bacterium]|nr:glycine--tRNA ligase subunit beta [bacterium]
MSKTLNFQEIIMRLERFWADHNCIIWQPYSEKVGAGTMNAATVLRVLGPEPWNVAYVEPSYRPDDGRFGENPNRMQMHTQYQVILKPDPGNPQELYLDSLEALGLDRKQHDIRFVEDNWESPVLGAWGLGWEVWLDGMEITQFTYFQQAGGQPVDPVAVEITYGLERIAMYLQDASEVWQLKWNDTVTYGDILKKQEVEYCNYEFYWADVNRLQQMYDLFIAEAKSAIDRELVMPAHDYILRCSHTFNLLDVRGAIGVTERARFFAQMRDLARQVADLFVGQRKDLGHPLLPTTDGVTDAIDKADDLPQLERADFLLELGSEELPPADVQNGIAQLKRLLPERLKAERLSFDEVEISGTPRRLYALVKNLSGRQPDEERLQRGPAVKAAYDEDGNPTPALEGFCRGQGVDPKDVEHKADDKGVEYVFALRKTEGQTAQKILSEALPELIASIHFVKTMRWDSDGVSYPRPLRWIVALFGDQVIPFQYARATSGRKSRGLRPDKSPEIELASASDYLAQMETHGLTVNRDQRLEITRIQVSTLAEKIGGMTPEDPDLLDEVTDLVEAPFALQGTFEEIHLKLPPEVLVSVMKKHQRYFPIVHPDTKALMPTFITVCNGIPDAPDLVVRGNEGVVRARYADAAFFYREDSQKPLEDHLPRLDTLTFQEDLGSVRDKTRRIERLVGNIAEDLGLSPEEKETSKRVAHLSKADLATSMVVEMTSLQGIIGRYYALAGGESEAVAWGIEGHYHPRFPGDTLPESPEGFAVSVADRLDSLAGLFSAGIKPRSTADPYGLRRDALGLLANLLGRKQHFSLKKGLEAAAKGLPIKADPQKLDQALEFILRRLDVQLREEGFNSKVVEAAITGGCDNPYEIRRIVEGLSHMVSANDWLDTLHAYSRCKRIVRDLKETYPLTPEKDSEETSQALHKAYLKARQQIDHTDNPISSLSRVLKDLQAPINQLFDDVMVMAEEPGLRQSRLALIQHIAKLPDGIADLSQLEGF